MATTSPTPMSPGAQAMYDSVMQQLSNIDERVRESLIETQQAIARFERTHRMTSVEMREKLDAGTIAETDEICQWLIELDVLSGILADLR
jgi:hypothetical protein